MSDKGIEDFLRDEEPSAEPAAAPAEASPEAAAPEEAAPGGQPRDDKGRFSSPSPETGGDAAPAAAAPEAVAASAPEEAQPGAPPTSAESPLIPRTALLSERQKRQAAERRIQELEALVSQPRPQPPTAQPTAEEEVDFYDDPNAFLERRFATFGSQLLDQFELRQAAQRANKSEAAARAKYPDYDDAVVEFRRLVASDRSLIAAMRESDDPGEFAYRKGLQALRLSEIGDLDTYEAQLRAKWEAELLGKAPATPSSPPPSTAGERSLGVSRAGPAWTGPTPLSDLLGET